MADEPRRSVRATKGQHTKSLDLLDQPVEPTKKRSSKKATTKKAAQEEVEGVEEDEIIRCVCGVTEQDDESDEDWIACETCSAWQHNVCMGVTTEKALLDNLNYWCEQCKPENHKELLDGIARGEKPWEQRRKAYEEAEREAQKARKGKKGKGKRTSDPKPEATPNGKTNGAEPTVDVKKEKEKDKKEVIGRAGSTKRKAKDDPPEDPAKTKVRKVSTPQSKSVVAVPPASVAPADIPLTIEELEKNRQGVAKFIYKNLQFALKNAKKNGTYTGSDGEMEQKAIRLALEIERATFDTNSEQRAYGTQGRKVGSNLKINQELCDRLLQNTLTPSALAVMTDDEMASQELQRQTAEMKARAEKQSIMVTDDGPRIRRTHKGDEVIEEENSAVPSDEPPPAARRRSMADPNAGMGARSRENSPGEEVELPQDIDDYRSQDDIRGNAAPTQPLTIDTKATPPLRKASTTQPSDFDINKVFSSVKSPTVTQHARKPSGQIPNRDGPGDDPEIDKLLEDGNESPPYSPTDYDADPTIVWRGTLIMNSVADFPAVARHIGGADLSNLGTNQVPWNDLIPPRLQVAGRIDEVKANQYLCSLRYSVPTDVVVLALTPTGETANAEFTKLFDYFHGKKRYGVVGNKGLANVRDTYLVPVQAGTGNVPEFLMNLENNKLAETRSENMILVTLAIRHDIVPQHERPIDGNTSPSTPALVNHPQRQMSIGGFSQPAMSPIQPQGSFGSPITPQVQAPNTAVPSLPVDQQQAEAQRRQRIEAQTRGEAVAHEILGPHISAPTVSFLMPQAWQMQPNEWQIIRDIYEQEPKAQEDLTFLSQLLEKKNATKAA